MISLHWDAIGGRTGTVVRSRPLGFTPSGNPRDDGAATGRIG